MIKLFKRWWAYLTAKLTGGNGAQRNCRPVQRLVRQYLQDTS